jgi:flagellin
MALSIQTNVNSLVAQENLRVNNDFQSRTIGRLTSGYRINSSGDDAAGLAVANGFRASITELMQGVRNANDGISQLQIIDGGISNISHMLDRMKTLATQSASTTFTGNRATLNSEFQALVTEVDRQAASIGLQNNGKYNTSIQVYIGGGNIQTNSSVTLDLSGTGNTVDASGLGIASRTIAAGGNVMGTVAATGAGATTFTLKIGSNSPVVVTVGAYSSRSAAVDELNTKISSYGLSATLDSSNQLLIGGSSAFQVTASGATGMFGGNAAVNNASVYNFNVDSNGATAGTGYITPSTTPEVINFTNSKGTFQVSIAAGRTAAQAVDDLNAVLASKGIYAFNEGSNINIQSSEAFSMSATGGDDDKGIVAGASASAQSASSTAPDATTNVNYNSLTALTSLTEAVTRLGAVQGKVGTGQNKLAYSIALAQSQISNFSAAESRIRDADVAAEAANLTKAQVLQQASLAAMAQANSAPQAVLALLRG